MNIYTERITASTDLGGMNPNFDSVRDIYRKAGFRNVGLEVVWLKNQNQYVHDLSCGFSVFDAVDGFHGQLGTEDNPNDHRKGAKDWLLVKTADLLIPNEAKRQLILKDMLNPLEILPPLARIDMIGSTLDRDIYLNVHDDVVANQYRTYRDDVRVFHTFSHLTI